MSNLLVPCDGCGQPADSIHIARRLERLAWSTRFRPLHMQALLLGGIAPAQNKDFLYAPDSQFQGEGGAILAALRLNPTGKSVEAVLIEFQKLGLMLAHVLECPLAEGTIDAQTQALFEKQVPMTITRIRRSLKPKRLLILFNELLPFAQKFQEAGFGIPVLPASGAFLTDTHGSEANLQAFRSALPQSNAGAV